MDYHASREPGQFGPAGSYGPPPGWSPPAWAPAARPQAPLRAGFAWARLLPTMLVALVIAGVVLGGIGLDKAIAAPSAGTLVVGGTVRLTAAPGWVLDRSGDVSSGIELRKAGAVLTAEVVAPVGAGGSASLLAEQRPSLDAEAAQISYGDVHTTTINDYDTSFVVFQATVVSQGGGVLDGELICMVVDGNDLVIFVAARQGHLDPVIDDITAMLKSVGVNG
ncbi:MAG TPA: hypothetical protein VF337_03830 [Candidatus Limnocylindrales bacterium]